MAVCVVPWLGGCRWGAHAARIVSCFGLGPSCCRCIGSGTPPDSSASHHVASRLAVAVAWNLVVQSRKVQNLQGFKYICIIAGDTEQFGGPSRGPAGAPADLAWPAGRQLASS